MLLYDILRGRAIKPLSWPIVGHVSTGFGRTWPWKAASVEGIRATLIVMNGEHLDGSNGVLAVLEGGLLP